jgi:pimeloyl-ACP methyl ester carboxylesterase
MEVLTNVTKHGLQPSKRTMQVVRAFDLEQQLASDARGAIIRLRETLENDPGSDKLYAVAELSYIEGKRLEGKSPDQALAMFGQATVFAYEFLFGPQFRQLRNPYDPEFRGACDLYNGGLEGALRIAKKRKLLNPGAVERLTAADHEIELTISLPGKNWGNDSFEKFEFVSDYEIKGLPNHYQTYGLGVPLIGVRRRQPDRHPADKYSPPGVSVPMTAFLRLSPGDSLNGRIHHAALEIYDTIDHRELTVGQQLVPLETDLTTPLAYSLNQPELQNLDSSTSGLIHPDHLKQKGIFMLDPYQPGKIPVVMVHGLWSSPITWMEMFNDLRSDPVLREKYQFWFYLYPSGQPFWFSAAMLRSDLVEVRQTLDPSSADPSFDRMVLVGHSMGGLVSRLQTLESGDEFWKTVSDQPISSVRAKDENILKGLEATFYFHPSPSVRRVVTIGTPHRGSSFSNETTRYLSSKFIKLPALLVTGSQQLRLQNPHLFRSGSPIDVYSSIDSLNPKSTFLQTMLSAPQPEDVKLHNILGRAEHSSLVQKFVDEGDGVVSFASGHLENPASEVVVAADHLHVHRHPLAVLEVRRILHEHLGLLEPGPYGQEPITPLSQSSASPNMAATHLPPIAGDENRVAEPVLSNQPPEPSSAVNGPPVTIVIRDRSQEGISNALP